MQINCVMDRRLQQFSYHSLKAPTLSVSLSAYLYRTGTRHPKDIHWELRTGKPHRLHSFFCCLHTAAGPLESRRIHLKAIVAAVGCSKAYDLGCSCAPMCIPAQSALIHCERCDVPLPPQPGCLLGCSGGAGLRAHGAQQQQQRRPQGTAAAAKPTTYEVALSGARPSQLTQATALVSSRSQFSPHASCCACVCCGISCSYHYRVLFLELLIFRCPQTSQALAAPGSPSLSEAHQPAGTGMCKDGARGQQYKKTRLETHSAWLQALSITRLSGRTCGP